MRRLLIVVVSLVMLAVAVPVQGAHPVENVALGADVSLRGEKGTLRISPGDLLRMHWNPFHPFMQERILSFVAAN